MWATNNTNCRGEDTSLRHYPVYLDLVDQPVLVVGAGKVALRKAKGLVEAGAQVTVVAPSMLAAFSRLPVRLVRRRFRASDLSGVRLVFAATDDRRTNRRIGALAKARGLWVNVADSAEECGFLVPARITRGSIQVAISTGGTNPKLSADLRRHLDKIW